jgi:hypothetical protein
VIHVGVVGALNAIAEDPGMVAADPVYSFYMLLRGLIAAAGLGHLKRAGHPRVGADEGNEEGHLPVLIPALPGPASSQPLGPRLPHHFDLFCLAKAGTTQSLHERKGPEACVCIFRLHSFNN